MVLDFLSTLDIDVDLDTEALDDALTTLDLDLTPDGGTLDEALETLTPLSLAEIFSPGFTSEFENALAFLDESTGEIIVENGVLSGIVNTPDGVETVVLDGTEFFSNWVDQAETLTASATLTGGVFTGELTVDGATFDTAIDVASLVESAVFALLNQADTVIPFAGGQFDLEIPTGLGDISGSVGFTGGQLSLDLATTLGTLDADFDFPAEAAFPFEFSTSFGDQSGSVDLAAGQVVVPIEVNGFSLGALSVGLDELTGQVSLQSGVATIMVDLPDFGITGFPEMIETDFELSPLVDELVEGLIDATGALDIGEGLVTLFIDSQFGSLDTEFSLVGLATDALDIITATNGSLSLDGDGNVVTLLETPLGGVDTTLTLSEISEFFASPLLG
ncbi:MAG: hypothetical protein AAFN18_17120 [Cyanobacteria bacterium J06554_6]